MLHAENSCVQDGTGKAEAVVELAEARTNLGEVRSELTNRLREIEAYIPRRRSAGRQLRP